MTNDEEARVLSFRDSGFWFEAGFWFRISIGVGLVVMHR